jgi:hypothetical protein
LWSIYDVIAFPVNVKSQHWSTLLLYHSNNDSTTEITSLYFDSLQWECPAALQEGLITAFAPLHINFEIGICGKQEDSFSCGPIVVRTLQEIIMQSVPNRTIIFDTTTKSMEAYRLQMLYRLLIPTLSVNEIKLIVDTRNRKHMISSLEQIENIKDVISKEPGAEEEKHMKVIESNTSGKKTSAIENKTKKTQTRRKSVNVPLLFGTKKKVTNIDTVLPLDKPIDTPARNRNKLPLVKAVSSASNKVTPTKGIENTQSLTRIRISLQREKDVKQIRKDVLSRLPVQEVEISKNDNKHYTSGKKHKYIEHKPKKGQTRRPSSTTPVSVDANKIVEDDVMLEDDAKYKVIIDNATTPSTIVNDNLQSPSNDQCVSKLSFEKEVHPINDPNITTSKSTEAESTTKDTTMAIVCSF